MTRRTFVRASAAGALAVGLGSCSASPPAPAGTVRLAGGFFGFPSPFAYIAGPGYVQMSLLYDTLVWKDAGGRMLPWLAERWQGSADGLRYRFTLRPGIRWHDGRPLTAQDVAFTFTYFARQPLGPLIVAQPYGVRSARAIDPRTAEIVLDRPAVTFLEAVAGTVPIIPRHVWALIDDAPRAQDLDVLVGSGPYRVAAYAPGEGATRYVANDRYFLGMPFVRAIELHPVDDELTALRAGVIDVAETPAEGVPPSTLEPLRDDDAFGIVQDSGGFSFPLIFNLARRPLGDVRVRRACALAIDRGQIVQRLLGGNGRPGNPGFLPPDHPFAVRVQSYEHDPLAAGALLDAAGYTTSGSGGLRRARDGTPLRLDILTGNAPVPAVLDLLVAALRDVGVGLRPQAVDLPTLFGRTQQGAFDLALTLYPGPGGTAPNSDPDTLRTFFSSRIRDRLQGAQGYADPELDRLAELQLVTADVAERRRALARMQVIIARDLPALPLYYPTLFTVFRKRAFAGWRYTPGGFAGGLPGVLNKQVLITGSASGVRIRRRP